MVIFLLFKNNHKKTFSFQTIDYTSPRGGISVVNSEQIATTGLTSSGENGNYEEGTASTGQQLIQQSADDIPAQSKGYTSTLLIHKVTHMLIRKFFYLKLFCIIKYSMNNILFMISDFLY